MDAAKLDAAIAFAKARETNWPTDFSTQEKIFGSLLGPIPKARAATNGLVIRNGYVVAEFGDTNAADPTYSVAKSMLATVAGVAVREGLIKDLDAPVGSQIKDGGYDSPQNAKVTWRHHLQQESEWEGEMWGKKHDFVGTEAFGDGERKPRALQAPGTFYEYNDVRINRFALSLLRLFKKPVPDVFRDEVMNVIGASNTWQWMPYKNSYADVDGKKLASVSGGTRWGGGVWINSWDMARFGYLWLRNGKWGTQADRPAGLREDGADAERARPGLRVPVVAEHEGRGEDAADQLVPGPGRGQQHHLRLARSRPRHRVAVAWGREGGVLPAGDCVDSADDESAVRTIVPSHHSVPQSRG